MNNTQSNTKKKDAEFNEEVCEYYRDIGGHDWALVWFISSMFLVWM